MTHPVIYGTWYCSVSALCEPLELICALAVALLRDGLPLFLCFSPYPALKQPTWMVLVFFSGLQGIPVVKASKILSQTLFCGGESSVCPPCDHIVTTSEGLQI